MIFGGNKGNLPFLRVFPWCPPKCINTDGSGLWRTWFEKVHLGGGVKRNHHLTGRLDVFILVSKMSEFFLWEIIRDVLFVVDVDVTPCRNLSPNNFSMIEHYLSRVSRVVRVESCESSRVSRVV